MNRRELLKKPFWGPTDLMLFTGISVGTARSRLTSIRNELSSQGFINLDNSKAPTDVVISRLNINLNWYEEYGMLDIDLNVKKEGVRENGNQ